MRRAVWFNTLICFTYFLLSCLGIKLNFLSFIQSLFDFNVMLGFNTTNLGLNTIFVINDSAKVLNPNFALEFGSCIAFEYSWWIIFHLEFLTKYESKLMTEREIRFSVIDIQIVKKNICHFLEFIEFVLFCYWGVEWE